MPLPFWQETQFEETEEAASHPNRDVRIIRPRI